MTLRHKLLSVFGGLAALALLLAGLTLWTTARWEESERLIESHAERSLQLQRLRARSFQAMKEAMDALLDDPDARAEFAAALEPGQENFERWVELSDTPAERAEVERVQTAHAQVLADAEQVFAMVEHGKREAAAGIAEDELEESYARFAAAIEAVAREDRVHRDVVNAAVEKMRRTARTILLIAAVATISLVLLLAAYLAADLFRPLKRVELGLDDLARGDLGTRLEEERSDEIGHIQRAFNRLAASLERRAGLERAAAGDDEARGDWRDAPSRVTLHALLARLRARAARLRAEPPGAPEAVAALDDVEALATAASRAADFGFPLDLDMEQADPGDLLYEVLRRFREEFARAGVSCEVTVDPTLDRAVLDRLKLREALSEAVRNALAALPNRGGRIGLRALRAEQEGYLLLEVADDGGGMQADLVERALAAEPFERQSTAGPPEGGGRGAPKVGLALARAVAERHGGHLDVMSEPGTGTVVRFTLPLRE